MTFRLELGDNAIRQIDQFFDYLRRFSFQTADKYENALAEAIQTYLINSPATFNYYWETGAPNRAFLFNLSRTSYWVIYRIYEDEGIVRVLSFHNTASAPDTHWL